MKAKKLIALSLIFSMSAASCFALAGCGDSEDCTHDYVWVTTTPATCDADGEETGTCKICQETTTRTIGKHHSYGEWQVTVPGYATAGSATKECAANAEHKLTVALPGLSDKASYSSVTETNTPAGVPERTYVLNNAEGNIEFKIDTALSVGEAVKLADYNSSKVIKGTANAQSKTVQEGGQEELSDELKAFWGNGFEIAVSNAAIKYEFGENYVHIKDNSEDTDGYYTKNADGSIFAVLVQNASNNDQAIKDERDEETLNKQFSGYGFGFTYSLGAEVGFGVENFVNELYTGAKNNANHDFKQSVTEVDGKTVYTFSYGIAPSASLYGYFHVINVSFTLGKDNALDSATLECLTYVTTSWDPATDTTTDIGVYTVDEDTGICTLNEGMADKWKDKETYTITQTTALAEGEETPTNPFKYEEMVIQSFQITASSGAVTKGEDGKYHLSATKPAYFSLGNIQPKTYNTYFDSINIFLKTPSGELEPLDYNYADGNYGHIVVYFNRETNSITMTPWVAGEFTVVAKSELVTKELPIVIPFEKPTGFHANAYRYNEITDVALWNASANAFTVYQGQAFNFASSVAHPSYQKSDFTAEVIEGPASVTLTDGVAGGKDVKVFKSDTVGTYTIKLTSTEAEDVTNEITVTVVEAPAVSNVLNGLYLSVDKKIDVEVTFTPSEADATNGTATIVYKQGDNEAKTTLNYAYNAETKAIDVTNAAGGHADWNYGFTLTEQFNLFLTYQSEFGESVKVLIANKVINTMEGDFNLGESEAKALEFTVPVSGNYTFTLLSNQTTFYRINDDENVGMNSNNNGMSFLKTFTVRLAEGDVFKIWSVTNRTVSIVYSVPVEPTSVSLNESSVTMYLGSGTFTLVASFEPSNTTETAITWSSSDTSVVLVDKKGVLRAQSEGTAVITVTTSNGLTATCTVTVVFVETNNIEIAQQVIEDDEVVYQPVTSLDVYVGGEEVRLYAKFTPDNASNKTVTWSSSDEEVLTINSNGLITALKAGTATVTVTTAISEDTEITATCLITVTYIDLTGVTISETATAIEGTSLVLTNAVNFAPANASNKNITWTSSDETVATVSASGVVAALKAGTATITITTEDGSFTATCTLTVLNELTELGEYSAYLARNKNVTFTFKGEAGKTYAWKTSSTAFSLFTINGKSVSLGVAFQEVEADENGMITFSMTPRSLISTFKFTIVDPEAPVEVKLGEPLVTMLENQNCVFTGEANTLYNIKLYDTYDDGVLGYVINGEGGETEEVTVNVQVMSDENGKIVISPVLDGIEITVTKAE